MSVDIVLSVGHVVLWSAAVSALVCGVCLSGAWLCWRGARTELVVHDEEGRVAARANWRPEPVNWIGSVIVTGGKRTAKLVP